MACSERHSPFHCPKIQELGAADRWRMAVKEKRCTNCLSPDHVATSCQSEWVCRFCSLKHHSLLHPGKPNEPQPSISGKLQCNAAAVPLAQVLLGTVLLHIRNRHGKWIKARGFLDSGSDASYVTEELLKRLAVPSKAAQVRIVGFTGTDAAPGTATADIVLKSSRSGGQRYSLQVIVVPTIAHEMPAREVPAHLVEQFQQLPLADPDFHKPAPVEVLIGADLFFRLLTGRTRAHGITSAVETTLGWIVCGPIQSATNPPRTAFHAAVDPLSMELRRFWELEEVAVGKQVVSVDQEQAEKIFTEGHYRTPSGRYVVPLLRNPDAPEMGSTYNGALRCYESLRRKLKREPALKSAYDHFMADYLEAGHMELAKPEDADPHVGSYLPHHGVLKPTPSGFKLRVVFNGSFRSSSGAALNDTLLTGPNLLGDISTILMKCRFARFVFTTDIAQMFRQFLVRPEERVQQKILWSFDEDAPPESYTLRTVTYGLRSSPFLATRVLRQLADDEGADFPRAAAILRTGAYVDDIIVGADSVEEAISLRDELIALLKHPELPATWRAVVGPKRRSTTNSGALLVSRALIDDAGHRRPVRAVAARARHVKAVLAQVARRVPSHLTDSAQVDQACSGAADRTTGADRR